MMRSKVFLPTCHVVWKCGTLESQQGLWKRSEGGWTLGSHAVSPLALAQRSSEKTLGNRRSVAWYFVICEHQCCINQTLWKSQIDTAENGLKQTRWSEWIIVESDGQVIDD